jgi:hypothetical protein
MVNNMKRGKIERVKRHRGKVERGKTTAKKTHTQIATSAGTAGKLSGEKPPQKKHNRQR